MICASVTDSVLYGRRKIELLKTDVNFQNIIDTFAERVFNHAYRMLGRREDAEEATQDVFLKVHKGLEGFRGESQLSTWIWRITTNVCLTRRSKRVNNLTTFFDDNELENVEAEDGSNSNPEEIFIAREERQRINQPR